MIATTSTDACGYFEFSNLTPGNYVLDDMNPSTDYEDVADFDSVVDGDPFDGKIDVDSKVIVRLNSDDDVFVQLNSNDHDDRNDFVDKLETRAISFFLKA